MCNRAIHDHFLKNAIKKKFFSKKNFFYLKKFFFRRKKNFFDKKKIFFENIFFFAFLKNFWSKKIFFQKNFIIDQKPRLWAIENCANGDVKMQIVVQVYWLWVGGMVFFTSEEVLRPRKKFFPENRKKITKFSRFSRFCTFLRLSAHLNFLL